VISKKILIFLVFVFLVVLGLLLLVFRTRLTFLGKATESNAVSLSQSRLFAYPLLLKADGQEKAQIFAFALNEEGRGISGKKIQVFSNPPLEINPAEGGTDKYGQAIFEAKSSSPGQFMITASVDGQSFIQTVTLTFQ